MDGIPPAGMKVFPESYPDGCPCDEVPFADCEVFRVVGSNPPIAGEFSSWAEQGKITEGHECECHGVSVFRDRDDAEFYAEKYPHLGEFVAQATLSPDDGKLAHTPRRIRGIENSHSTWWPFTNVVRHALFTVVGED